MIAKSSRTIAFILFIILSFTACSNSHIAMDNLYPDENIHIDYHSKWTKISYPKRIETFKNSPLEKGDIVFLGNSITQNGGDWSKKFGRNDVKNRGISGDVTDGILARLNEICYAKPKAVFIMIGINDIYNWYNDWGIPSPKYVGKNIPKITKFIHKHSPKSKIYVQTILPTDLEDVKEAIILVNNMIKNAKNVGHFEVIDLYSKFVKDNGFIKDELTTDGIHLTEKGYDLWVKIVEGYLE